MGMGGGLVGGDHGYSSANWVLGFDISILQSVFRWTGRLAGEQHVMIVILALIGQWVHCPRGDKLCVILERLLEQGSDNNV